jgi:hypothetical protein
MIDASKAPLMPAAYIRLRPDDYDFWHGIVRARARSEWTDSDLVVAAQLARCQSDIEKESILMDQEGTVVVNDKGTSVVNPRVSVLEQFARREMALMRTLRMAGRVAGDPDKQAGRQNILRQAEKAREMVEDEDLLAS